MTIHYSVLMGRYTEKTVGIGHRSMEVHDQYFQNVNVCEGIVGEYIL